jgi:NADPH:quinone reductase-like Zn-dependent oxidoreductase
LVGSGIKQRYDERGPMNTADATSQQPRQMKALRAHARGGPEQLTYEDAPVPAAPSGTDLCVQVEAAAITFDELSWPDTWESDGVERIPIIPSHEFAGVVSAIGPDVDAFSIGDEVFGLVPFNRDGAAAEYVLVPASYLALKPASVSDVVAAAAVLPALTAMEALDEHLGLVAGQRLLVRGGTGGVGSFLVQFAHSKGIAVTATVRSSTAVERVMRLGADEVLVADEPAGITPESFDASIDAVGAGTPEWLYRAVRPGGRVITLQEPPDADLAHALGVDARFFVVSAQTESLQRLATVLAAGGIDVAVAQTYPLAEGRAAYASRGLATRPGKTVLEVTTL